MDPVPQRRSERWQHSPTAGQKRAYSPAATHNTGIGKSPAQNRPQSAINVLHLHPGTPSRAQKRPLKAICVQHYFRQGRPPPCSGTGLRPSEKLVRSPAPAPKDGPHELDPELDPKREERTPGAQTRPSPGTGPSEQSDGPSERRMAASKKGGSKAPLQEHRKSLTFVSAKQQRQCSNPETVCRPSKSWTRTGTW